MAVIQEDEEGAPYLPKKSDGIIRAELRNVIESRIFAQASRLARFLRFVVEHYLSGETERLKETVIGIEVYDRPRTATPKSIPLSEPKRAGCGKSCRSTTKRKGDIPASPSRFRPAAMSLKSSFVPNPCRPSL
jgi:hypothetical protein